MQTTLKLGIKLTNLVEISCKHTATLRKRFVPHILAQNCCNVESDFRAQAAVLQVFSNLFPILLLLTLTGLELYFLDTIVIQQWSVCKGTSSWYDDIYKLSVQALNKSGMFIAHRKNWTAERSHQTSVLYRFETYNISFRYGTDYKMVGLITLVPWMGHYALFVQDSEILSIS